MLWILLFIIILLGVYAISVYNALIRLKNQVQEGWSGIDVQLKRRYNLIPNLIEAVKGYQKHESSVFEDVTKLRTEAMGANGAAQKGMLESALTAGLGRLLAVAENYPDLKASANFIELQKELANTEDQIQLARRYYNGTVREFNTKIQSFPQNLFANALGFKAFEYFELDSEKEREVPKVDFSSGDDSHQ